MVIARKTATSSSPGRGPVDPGPSRKRGRVPSDDGPAWKSSHLDENQARETAAIQPDLSLARVRPSSVQSAEVLPIRSGVLSLEDYRLKAPDSLPAANAQGFRVIKDRLYVDIAAGEIALVRQTATTGEYRATLVSERTASGPVLAFDPQNRIWKPEVAQSSPDKGDVIDIDIDELIRGIRNDSTEKHRVHDGNDDSIERDTLTEAALVARGLTQFSPIQAELIRSELRVVETVFSDANDVIAMKLPDADTVYESFFGADHRIVAAQFADSVARGLALSREYQGVWGGDKFIGVDIDNQTTAWMYKSDFHGRFFINRKFMKSGLLSMSFGHEMLHTNRVDRFKSIGANAADFFYLHGSQRALLNSDSRTVYDVPERGISDAIMRGGLTVDYLKATTDNHDSFLIGVSDYLGIPDDLDLDEAVRLFNADSQLRARMAANNADSLIFAAKSLQTWYHNKIEYAWLDSLIND
ncbi:hypothetical protein [Pseudomonas fluorescens]|uniref:hypothetical protein n=1 Tax=Pseudomonas fluorescens TaxID=294 RepID=UPI001E64A309|nr:hypothetical protein [Pseudomonas fluorescens]